MSESAGKITFLICFAFAVFCAAPLVFAASSNVTLNGSLAGGTVEGVCVEGNYAYLAATAFLSIVDISVPANPSQVSYIATSNNANSVKVTGGYAYVADSSGGLRIIDVSNPSAPSETGYYYESYETSPGYGVSNTILGVDIVGDYAYIADAQNAGVAEPGLKVIDISNKAAPQKVGYCHTAQAYDVQVENDIAYVVDYSSGLYIIDVSTPASPSQLGYIQTDQWAKHLYVDGNYAYVIHASTGLWIVDVSISSSPAVVGKWGLPGNLHPGGIFVSSGVAYIGYGTSGLYTLNVSTPSAPSEIGNLAAEYKTTAVSVRGNYAYMGDWAYGFRIIDISNTSSPSLVVGSDMPTPNFAYDVDISGNYAYVADFWKGCLEVIDVTNPDSPSHTSFSANAGWARAVETNGNYAYVTGYMDSNLHIMDISNPANVTESGSIHLPGYTYGVCTDGSYAYVADDTGGLKIIDVSNPASPSEKNTNGIVSKARDVAVSGNYAYVVDQSSGLVVMDISFKPLPTVVWRDSSLSSGQSIAISDGYAYVTGGTSLFIYDLTIASAPVARDSYSAGGSVYSVKLKGKTAYIANGTYKGLTVLDVSDPDDIQLAGYYATPGSARGVAVDGDNVYVGSFNAGLLDFLYVPNYRISGYVRDGSGTAIKNYPVELSGDSSASALTDSVGHYEFSSLAVGSYTVTASSRNYTVTPASIDVFLDGSYSSQNFTAVLSTYNISGYVKDNSSDVLSGINVTLGDIVGPNSYDIRATTVTAPDGSYSFYGVPGNGNYIVEPSSAGYSFSPQSVSTYTLSATLTGRNFFGTLGHYFISGEILSSGTLSRISGVIVTLSGSASSQTVTDSYGFYKFSNLAGGGTYKITPYSPQYTFIESSGIVSPLTGDSSVYFYGVAVPQVSSSTISGYVYTAGNIPVNGVTLTLSSGAASSSCSTDSSGYYSISVADGGNYTLTPSKTGFVFSPQNYSYTAISSDKTAQNFDSAVKTASSGEVKVQGGAKGFVNPASGEEASIVFKAPSSGNVDVKIYNLRGQLVWQTSASVTGGADSIIKWAAKNASGNVVSSGIYIIYIKGAGLNIKKKVAVIK